MCEKTYVSNNSMQSLISSFSWKYPQCLLRKGMGYLQFFFFLLSIMQLYGTEPSYTAQLEGFWKNSAE